MDSIIEQHWDYIVIGTGMGGATAGYALAKAGCSVLFLERGRSHFGPAPAFTGDFAECSFGSRAPPGPGHAEQLAAAGRYQRQLDDISGDRTRTFIPFIGAGTGGSSALYGMALERFFPQDFAPRRHHGDGGNSSTLPGNWPLGYEALSPYYQQAEALYAVRGSVDPLRADDAIAYPPPPPLMPPNQRLFEFLQAKGLHPYQLPLACEHLPDCSGCQSFLCARACKNDSSRSCLRPALEQHGAALLEQCDALRLESDSTAVQSLVCRYQGREITLHGRCYIAAAGALETPRLLLQSASSEWPDGLGNRSGLVGKNLMRHYVDLYALFPGGKIARDSRVKELAFNDLYQGAAGKLGSVQSFGLLPPPAILVEEMAKDIGEQAGALAGAAFLLAKPVLRLALGQLFSRALIMASILEDLPYEHNRLTLSDRADANGVKRLQLHYTVSDSEQARIDTFRRELKNVFSPHRFLLLQQADNNQRIAHICGTCRFGDDPGHSVCDGNNKVHGLDNLYIADSSVFPSSGGINPSLTIAALSLRLAQHLEDAKNG